MILRVGACEIDSDRRLIRLNGVEQRLPRKAFDLLLALLERRPKVMAKDDLIKRVWPDTFVADANLAILIGDVRAALGDDAKEPRIIKTHHRIGYSFAADVTELLPSNDRTDPVFVLVDAKRHFLLFEGAVRLGRDAGCDLVIDDASVSRVHAVLSVLGGQLTVEDRDSKNGTRVDSRRIDGVTVVEPGQRVKFGSIEMMVRDHRPAGNTTVTALGTDQ